jgi:hypothetical protein
LIFAANCSAAEAIVGSLPRLFQPSPRRPSGSTRAQYDMGLPQNPRPVRRLAVPEQNDDGKVTLGGGLFLLRRENFHRAACLLDRGNG